MPNFLRTCLSFWTTRLFLFGTNYQMMTKRTERRCLQPCRRLSVSAQPRPMSFSRPGRCGWTSRWIRTLLISKNFWASRVTPSPVMGKIGSLLNNSLLDSPASMPVKCAWIAERTPSVTTSSTSVVSAVQTKRVSTMCRLSRLRLRMRTTLGRSFAFLAVNLDTLPVFAPKGRLHVGATFRSATFVMHLDMWKETAKSGRSGWRAKTRARPSQALRTTQVLRMSLVEAWIHVVTWSWAHQLVEAPSLAFMWTFAVLVGLHVSWQR